MTHEYCVSRAFALDELMSALTGTGTGSGPAYEVARAALAPHVWARNAVVSLHSTAAAADDCSTPLLLRLVYERTVTALDPLQVWPDETLLAAARVPYLAPHNIRGGKEYVCHECGALFEYPNPLKVHLYLKCAPTTCTGDFWRTVATRLRGDDTELDVARLETLAAEWGKSAAGGARTHLCIYCGKVYSRKYGLKIHIRTHTGYRPLRCRYCARAFGDPSNLNKHVRLHTQHEQRALHVCSVCTRVLPRRRDLQRHVRTHHHK